jgi:hypothetical protein
LARTSIAGLPRHQASHSRGEGPGVLQLGRDGRAGSWRGAPKRAPLPPLHAWPQPSGLGGPTTQSKQFWPALVGMALVGALRGPGSVWTSHHSLYCFKQARRPQAGLLTLDFPKQRGTGSAGLAARDLQLLLRNCQTGKEQEAWTLLVRPDGKEGKPSTPDLRG